MSPYDPVQSTGVGATRPEVKVLPDGLRPDDVRTSLEQILASRTFSHSRRLGAFLRFVVEESLQGRSGELKELLIGLEVFGRRKFYDPRIDPIVRVEAGRIREKLAKYYEAEGRDSRLRIDLPKGRYSPEFLAAPPIAAPAVVAPVHGPEPAVSPRFRLPSIFTRPLPLVLLISFAMTISAVAGYWAVKSVAAKTAIPPAASRESVPCGSPVRGLEPRNRSGLLRRRTNRGTDQRSGASRGFAGRAPKFDGQAGRGKSGFAPDRAAFGTLRLCSRGAFAKPATG